jgi:hypothetical protein
MIDLLHMDGGLVLNFITRGQKLKYVEFPNVVPDWDRKW